MKHVSRLSDVGASPGTDRHSLILLRWTLFLAAAALFLSSRLFEPLPLTAIVLLSVFGLSNVLLQFYWKPLSKRPGADLTLAVLDTLIISLSLFHTGIEPTEMLVLSALVVALVALSRDIAQTVAAGIAVGVVYILIASRLHPEGILQNPTFLVRIPMLYSVALYFGYFAARASDERRLTEEIVQERRELRTLMEVIETINSSLDLHRVMLAITSEMAEAVKLSRCSALLVEKGEKRGLVIASNDVPDIDRLEIDLSRYPEVRRAIETRAPVVIEDVANHPLMRDVRQYISGAGFNSILVVPMIHQDDLIGTLMLRGASGETQFSPRVVAFCQAIASASANALKNALLYRQMREESSRHRSTVEKLQNILEHSMDLIVTTDLDGTITDFNRTAEEALGYRREEIVGRPLTEIYRGVGDRAEFLSTLRSAGQIDDRGATMTTRDGSRRIFDLTVAVVRNELGEVVGSVCVGKKTYAIH